MKKHTDIKAYLTLVEGSEILSLGETTIDHVLYYLLRYPLNMQARKSKIWRKLSNKIFGYPCNKITNFFVTVSALQLTLMKPLNHIC